ncbi:SDR family oxidoreductase [Acinetobacter bereziniae]|uniref:SDR family oxidoreductase n=1 Tax=Acinetobacter bereziniae TaxID=106648 RepID=UPI0022EAC63F|nr:SDR family oxidoreductase [Acinetobacter bereziniae]MDA3439285.1 SDR family oxidoreductase [Acinetobacter bereziniae]
MRLKDKTVLITGATSGIGFAAAQRAIEEGARVVFTGRNINQIAQVQQQLGSQSFGFTCDHADLNSQHDFLKKLQQLSFIFDVIYINAGNVNHQRFGQWSVEQFDEVLNTNLKGPFFLIQSLLPMINPNSSVILCGSTSIHIALEKSSVYAASKIALRSLVKTLSRELLNHKIRFNLLSPGPTFTPALNKVADSPAEVEQLKISIENLVPLQRLATATEIANAFIYLASDESRFVVGTELLIDGGVANL